MMYMKLSTWIKSETQKAISVEYSNGRQGTGSTNLAWFPKSRCIISHPENYADEKRMCIMVPVWCIPKNISSFEYNRFNGYEGIFEN